MTSTLFAAPVTQAAWVSRPLLTLDTESTGVNPFEARIVEIGAAVILPDRTVTHTWATIVDPGIAIPDEPAAIHGITTERAQAEGVAPVEALNQLAGLLHDPDLRGGPVCMFNAAYDWPLICTEAARHHVDLPPVHIVDPMVLDKHLTPRRSGKGSRKLTAVAELFGVDFTGAAHGALADCIAAGQLLRVFIDRYPQIAAMTLVELQVAQARWQHDQVVSLEEFFRRSEPDRTLTRGWPFPLY